MNFAEDLDVPTSFGLDISRPSQLFSRTAGSVLAGVVEGEWEHLVTPLRKLPPTEYREQKEQLPYWTPSGNFRKRATSGLLRHSGLIAIDVDHLTLSQAVRCVRQAAADPFALAAFRSISDTGVRLLFRIPHIETAEQHLAVYEQVAAHVRNGYDVTVDTSGSDVCRACFVTFDRGLWFRPDAEELPVSVPPPAPPLVASYGLSIASNGARALNRLWEMGREYAPENLKPDGTAFTHESICCLARKIAVQSAKQGALIGDSEIRAALDGWLAGARSGGHTLRRDPEEYFAELRSSVESIRRLPKFRETLDFWPRWRKAPGFPKNGSPKEQVIFAVQSHCRRTGKRQFYLSCMDAARIAGRDKEYFGSRLRTQLVSEGYMKLVAPYVAHRRANWYVLLTP